MKKVLFIAACIGVFQGAMAQTGNVGIGTTTPSAKLQVVGAGAGTVDLQVNGRIKTGDSTRSGGIWVHDDAFFGNAYFGEGSDYMGFYSGGVSWGLVMHKANGNVGIGTYAPAQKLHVIGNVFSDGGYLISSVNSAEGGALTLINPNKTDLGYLWRIYNMTGYGGNSLQFWNYPPSGGGSPRLVLNDGGNIGIGTQSPSQKLEVVGNIYASYNGQIIYGESGQNTLTRDDAGLQGDGGAKSGFFQTNNPVNYPAGASSWWHLIDTRHANPSNNYTMQIAGSFFDQELWFRKTNGNGAQPWRKVVSVDQNGNTNVPVGMKMKVTNQSLYNGYCNIFTPSDPSGDIINVTALGPGGNFIEGISSTDIQDGKVIYIRNAGTNNMLFVNNQVGAVCSPPFTVPANERIFTKDGNSLQLKPGEVVSFFYNNGWYELTRNVY